MNRHTLTITITTLCLSLGAAGCGGSEGAGHGSYGVPLTAPVRSAASLPLTPRWWSKRCQGHRCDCRWR